jgi:VanZ family protein
VATRARWVRGLSLWGPPAIYALAIFGFSSLSAPPVPPPQLTDKHVHLLVFAGLALVLVRALANGRWSGVTLATGVQAAILAIAYGATDVWHQSFVPGRDSNLLDLVAVAVGVLAAVGLLCAAARWGRRTGQANGRIERAVGKVGQTP